MKSTNSWGAYHAALLYDSERGLSSDMKWNENLDRYLSGLLSDESWSVGLRKQVASLRGIASDNYDLHVCSIEHHLDAQRGVHQAEPRYFTSFGELGDYLSSAAATSLKSRLIFFSRHEDRPDQGVGSRRMRKQTQLQASVAAKLACLLGSIWDIDYPTVDLLAGYPSNRDEVFLERSFENFFNIYDVGNDQSGEMTAHPFVQTVATTSPPPKYESDIEIVTSSLYTNPPRRDSVTLFFDKRPQHTEDHWRGILACSTTEIMDLVVGKFAQIPPTDQTFENESQIARCFLRHANEIIVSRTRSNLALINLLLSQMQYTVRRDPSRLKLNYIIHLQDHLEAISHFLKRNATVVGTEQSAAGSQEPWDPQEWIQKSSDEMTKHSQIASDTQAKARSIYATAKDQVASKDSARNKLFAALAAIYLPFTLAIGVLGMNIKEINGKDAIPPKWWILFILGLPLALVTVAIPLGFDSINRTVRQYARSSPTTYKRALWIVPSIVVVVIIVTVIVIVFVEVTKK